MQRLGGALAIALSLPAPMQAASLIINLWPSTDPDTAIYCALTLTGRTMVAVQVKGNGLHDVQTYRWFATDFERNAYLHALQALFNGTLPSDNPLVAPLPLPPYITVTWVAHLNGTLTSGRYVDTKARIPAELADMLAVLTPGSYCSPTASPDDTPMDTPAPAAD